MTVSIIIPTKNRHSDLHNACKSICWQIIKPNKVIIIDQSDENKSSIIINNLFQSHNIDCSFIYNPNITGLVEAKQFSLQFTNEDLIMFIEDDVELANDYVKKNLIAFSDFPEMLGSCGVDILNKRSLIFSILHYICHRGLFKDLRPYYTARFHSTGKCEINPCLVLSGGISTWRKSVFEKISFDMFNNFHTIEDIVFSKRVHNYFGSNSMYINSSVKLKHFMSTYSRSKDMIAFSRKIRENILFYKSYSKSKFCDGFSLVILLLAFFLEAILKSIKNKSFSYFNYFFIGIKEGISIGIYPQV